MGEKKAPVVKKIKIIVNLLRQEKVELLMCPLPSCSFPLSSLHVCISWFRCDRETLFPPDQRLNFRIMPETVTWLVISDGMGDGGLEWVLASWETKPESWEDTLLSRWAPAEGIWRRLWTGNHISTHTSTHSVRINNRAVITIPAAMFSFPLSVSFRRILPCRLGRGKQGKARMKN